MHFDALMALGQYSRSNYNLVYAKSQRVASAGIIFKLLSDRVVLKNSIVITLPVAEGTKFKNAAFSNGNR